MIFRTLFHAILSKYGRRLGHYDVAHTRFRVLPTDLDVLKHMNNGVYLSIADIGRFDLLTRSGVWELFKAQGWYPVVVSETVTFRRSLMLWQRFRVESRVLGFDDRAVYVEQRFVAHGEIYAQAFIKARILRKTGGTVPITELLDSLGSVPEQVAVPEWVQRWSADAVLPPARGRAPSVWD